MTMNRRTLMRMHLDKVILIAEYWGINPYRMKPLQAHYKQHHAWKRYLVNCIYFQGYGGHPDMKSEFCQWRRV